MKILKIIGCRQVPNNQGITGNGNTEHPSGFYVIKT